MRFIILALIPIAGFAVGIWLGRLRAPGDKRLQQDYNRMIEKLARADSLIDDLSIMAAEHATLGEAGGVLMQDKISNYRRGIK